MRSNIESIAQRIKNEGPKIAGTALAGSLIFLPGDRQSQIINRPGSLPTSNHELVLNENPLKANYRQVVFKTTEISSAEKAGSQQSKDSSTLPIPEQDALPIKTAATLAGAGYLLMTDAQRRRAMEAGTETQRKESSIGFLMHAAGVAGIIGTIWTM